MGCPKVADGTADVFKTARVQPAPRGADRHSGLFLMTCDSSDLTSGRFTATGMCTNSSGQSDLSFPDVPGWGVRRVCHACRRILSELV
jgi:hypothetical protein